MYDNIILNLYGDDDDVPDGDLLDLFDVDISWNNFNTFLP